MILDEGTLSRDLGHVGAPLDRNVVFHAVGGVHVAP
jgi:hypothetical protein